MALFCITCWDKPGVLDERVKHRPDHVAYLKTQEHMIKLAGPQLDLAHWLVMDDYSAETLGLERLPGLGDRDETVALWETLTGREHLLFYGRLKNLKGSVLTQVCNQSYFPSVLVHNIPKRQFRYLTCIRLWKSLLGVSTFSTEELVINLLGNTVEV